MTLSTGCRGKRFRASLEDGARAAGFTVLLLILAFVQSAAQGSAQATPAQEPSASTDAAAKLKPAAKPKKVYTNEDIEKPAAQESQGNSDEFDSSAGLMKCDASCERQASTEVYVGHDGVSNETAWKEQIVAARSKLAADAQFQDQLRKMIELMNIYCNYINPQTARSAPGGQSFDARIARQAEQYEKRTGQDMYDTFQQQARQMHIKINEVRFGDPVTGALMTVLSERAMKCSPYIP